jgi:hypothetical protein
MQQFEREAFDTAVSAAEKLAGQSAFAAGWAQGRALDPEDAVAEARAAVATYGGAPRPADQTPSRPGLDRGLRMP